MPQISLTRRPMIALLTLAAVVLEPARGLAESSQRLTGAEIIELISGKRIIFRDVRTATRGTAENFEYIIRTDGVVNELTFSFREDRSYRRLCMFRTRDGSTGGCQGPHRATGTGVWRVNDNTLCIGEIVLRGHEICYAIERAGAKYRCRYVSGGIATGAIKGYYDGLEFELVP